MIQFNMTGKVALVTGGSSGIGKAAAQAFLQAGARVVIAGRNQEKGEATVAELSTTSSPGSIEFIPADMASRADIEHLFDQIEHRFGRLDFAVNNAAGEAGFGKLLHEFEEEEFDQTIGVNLKGVWQCMRHEIKQMLRQVPAGGAIVNVSSVNGLGGVAGGSLYAASKAGVIALTKSAALEQAKAPLRINALVPGLFDTPLLNKAMQAQTQGDAAQLPAVLQQYEHVVPQGRIGPPEQAAQAILWLCSENVSYLTGQALVMDGGLSISYR